MSLRRDLRGERGDVVLTAVLLMSLMLGIGMVVYSQVDTQTAQSRIERERESSFNLAEAVLGTQTFILGRLGTGTAARPFPASCPAADGFCPDPAQLAQSFDEATQVDFGPSETEWTTWVRDDRLDAEGEPDYYWTDAILEDAAWPRWDANDDDHLWVRAEATVRGRKRAIVALIKVEHRQVTFPKFVILAGKFETSNQGNHSDAIVNTNGSDLVVRCGAGQPHNQPISGCVQFETKKGGQVRPARIVPGWPNATTLSAEDLQALIDVAVANGTYHTTCPGSLAGKVVVIDSSSLCAYQGNDTWNSQANPGLVILTRGKLELRGNATYYGLIYAANLDGRSDSDMVTTQGGGTVYGGVIVDGDGGITAGSNGKGNVTYMANAFDDITSFGTAGVVQNTWREIPPLN